MALRGLIAITCLLALLLAAGCTTTGSKPPLEPDRGAPPPGPVDAAPGSGAPGSGAPGSGGTETGSPDSASPRDSFASLPIREEPGFLQRLTFASTQEITEPGVYIVNAKSGVAETWQRTSPATGEQVKGSGQEGWLSADGRWIVSQLDGRVYWTHRGTLMTYSFDPRQVQVLPAPPERLLLAGRGNQKGQFWITDEQFGLIQPLALDLGERDPQGVRFSPDGRMLAITSGIWPAVEGSVNAQVDLIDLTTGQIHPLQQPPRRGPGRLLVRELTGPAPAAELLVHSILQLMEPTGLALELSRVDRYDWTGTYLGGYELLGRLGQISPDGKLIASSQNLGHLTSNVVVASADTGEPLFRVRWTGDPQWLADSSGLLLQRNGEYLLVTLAGELQAAPPFPRTETPALWPGLYPSPADASRFAAGLAVVDRAGAVVQEIKLAISQRLLVRGARWTADGLELTFSITESMGKGNLGGDGFSLPPRVERPPFIESYLFVVRDPASECLNLRTNASRSSQIIRCLPTGTRLALGDLFIAPVKLNSPLWFDDGQTWMWVRTEQGETGFVAVSTGAVTWVD